MSLLSLLMSSYVFLVFQVGQKTFLKLRIKLYRLTYRRAGEAHHSLSQVCRSLLKCTAFVNKPLHMQIKVKAALTVRAASQVLLHNLDLVAAQLAVNIEMQARNCFKTVHILHIHTFIH